MPEITLQLSSHLEGSKLILETKLVPSNMLTDLANTITRQEIDLKDKLIRETLIALGWTPPETAIAYKQQRDSLLEFCKNAPVSSGVCCCGDDMDAHSSEHSPVDQWDYSISLYEKEFKTYDEDQEKKNAQAT